MAENNLEAPEPKGKDRLSVSQETDNQPESSAERTSSQTAAEISLAVAEFRPEIHQRLALSPRALPGLELEQPPITSDKSSPVATLLVPAQITLADGTYKRDGQGRITEMISPNRDLKRQFLYEDPANPKCATKEIINDKTIFKYLGPVMRDGQPVIKNGFAVNSYSVYENGELAGNWSGIKQVSLNGIYSAQTNDDKDQLVHVCADGRPIDEANRLLREKVGIWPSPIEAPRPIETPPSVEVPRSLEIENKKGDGQISRSSSIREAQEQLLGLAQGRGLNTERMGRYLQQLDRTSQFYGSKPEQITKALDNLSEILAKADKSYLYNPKRMEQVVETGLHNLACPMAIDQGKHPTCNVAVVDIYAAAKAPDLYTDMLKQISLTGKYKAADGRVANPPTGALLPGEEEDKYDLDKTNSNVRNLASQIIQMTLINAAYELGEVKRLDPASGYLTARTDLRYVLKDRVNPNEPKSIYDQSHEDRLIDKAGNEVGKREHGPDFFEEDIAAASKVLLGQPVPYIAGPKIENGIKTYRLPSRDDLLRHKEKGSFPLPVMTLSGAHIQTIHDVKPNGPDDCWVLLDDQRGAEGDSWVSLKELQNRQLAQVASR